MNQDHLIVNFYKFVSLTDLDSLVAELKNLCLKRNLLGKILLAHEGINSSLSGQEEDLNNFFEDLRRYPQFSDVTGKFNYGETKPFKRLIVKTKHSIVTFTNQDPTPDEINSAPRLNPKEWDEWMEKENVIVVDTRNDYECDWGTFQNADCLPLKKFSDFPKVFDEKYSEQKDKKFLIFCTGGIRCEKAAPWLQKNGYENVYQLDGGILKYLEEIPEGKFKGSCFVFDQRWAVDGKLKETSVPLNENVLQNKPDVPTTA